MKGKVIINENSVIFTTATRTKETFPFGHVQEYAAAIKALKQIGYSNTPNVDIKQKYPTLSVSHRECRRKTIVAFAHICPNGFSVEFGVQGNVIDGCTAFCHDTHSKHINLTYLEKKAIQWAINEIKNTFCQREFLTTFIDIEDLRRRRRQTPIEKILADSVKNKHIHHGASTLEQLHESVEKWKNEPYFKKYNGVDRDGKEMSNGEIKYFYGYDRRLRCGTVYHNINNMWWVVCGSELINKSTFELFDFTEYFQRRYAYSTEKQIVVLEKLLKQNIEKRDFKRCQQIAAVQDRLRKES